MNGVDEADLALVESKNHGGGADTFAEEAHALQKLPSVTPVRGENHFRAGSEIFGQRRCAWDR